MAYTVPSDTHAVSDTGHTTDHNNLVDVVKGSVPYNVLNTAYAGGADPTGTTDSSAAINAAIAAASSAGGVVRVPPGTYKLTSPVQQSSGVILAGDDPVAAIFKPTASNNGINVTSASAMADVGITGIQIQGPGSGTGVGINGLANAGASRIERLTLANVIVTGMGSHGSSITNAIMSRADQCKFVTNGGRGLYLNQGTTWKVSNCWATGNTLERGFYLNQVISSTLLACGSDSNAIGYEYLSCTAIQAFGCDVSGTVAAGGLDGTSIKINGSYGVTIAGAFMANNGAVGLWVTAASGGCQGFGIIETAAVGATASVKTDSGTDLLLNGVDVVTATSYAANTISLLAGSYCFFSDGEFGIAQVDNGLTLLGGTTSTPPLKLTSGTNLTSAAAGAVEYDGTAFYDTAVASARQVRVTEQFQSLTSARTFTNNTSAQAIFNATANGAVTLAGSTAYDFECILSITGLSASAHTVNFGFGGTATFTSAAYQAMTATAAGGALSSFAVTSASATAITASTTGTVLQAVIRGTLRVNAGGTVIPQLTQVTASAAAVVAVNSQFRCWPKGSNTVTSVGNWS